jgi:hypothetical protein
LLRLYLDIVLQKCSLSLLMCVILKVGIFRAWCRS